MSDKISRKSASISTIPDAEITIPDAKINTWYTDGERRWRVLERETNWEQIDLIPSPIKAGIPCPPCEIPSKLKLVVSIDNLSDRIILIILKLGQADSEGSRSIGNPKNEEDAVSHGKSGGSLRSQSGTLKEGPVGLGKSGGSQGSGQNGSQTNGNDEEKSIPREGPSLSENPGSKNEEDSVSHGKSGGSLRSESGNLKEGSVGHGKFGGSLPIETLPDETLLNLFKFLKFKDLGRCLQVSKRFRKMALDETFWKKIKTVDQGNLLRVIDK